MSRRATGWGAYRRIADALRSRITNSEYAPGAAIPSEATLCAEYGVARNTLRRALDQLAAEGLITVHPGRGRVVASSGKPDIRPGPRYKALAADLRTLIESGRLKPGDALPSESALAAQYGVARGTARQALAELEGADLVESIHGKGRYVRRR